MTFRPFSSSRLRALSFGAALAAVAALGAVGTSAAPRNKPSVADGLPGPEDTPIPVLPTVALTTNYAFATPTSTANTANADGIEPSTLILSDNDYLVGTAGQGGANNLGTVFVMTQDGPPFVKIHDFTGTNGDGSSPSGALVAAGNNTYYGTTQSGGTSENGTIFKITLNADNSVTTYNTVYSFNPANSNADMGLHPMAALVADGKGNFYGTTTDGGANGNGEIFRLNASGTVDVLHSFDANGEEAPNTEGSHPQAALVPDRVGGFLGTTLDGGSSNGGTIYRYSPGASPDFKVVYTLGTDVNDTPDGLNPTAALTPDDAGTGFFLATQAGGNLEAGAIMHFNANFSVVALVYSFGELTNGESNDGNTPMATLVRGVDGNYYGTTPYGGANSFGTIFEIIGDGTADGTQYADIYDFTGGQTDGGYPNTSLVPFLTTSFFGTTPQTAFGIPDAHPGPGGPQPRTESSNGYGTMFNLNVIPAGGVVDYTQSQQVSEHGGTATVSVTRSSNSVGAITVAYTTQDGTAKAGLDYTATSGTLTWADGELSIKTVTVPILNRHISGVSSVSFSLLLQPPASNPGSPNAVFNASAGGAQGAIVQINDDDPVPVITSSISAAGQVGVAFTYQITATNFPISFGATNLPAGLSVNTTTGLISGTPTTAGSFTFGISATNANGTSNSAVLLSVAAAPTPTPAPPTPTPTPATPTPTPATPTPTPATPTPTPATPTPTPTTPTPTPPLTVVPAINSANSAAGQVGVAFAYQITAANAPVSFGTSELPDGLTVDIPTGLISGTPTVSGTFAVTLYAANAAGTGTGPLALTIAPAPVTTQPTQPTVAIVSPPDGITVEVGEAVPLAASITDTDSVLASVSFLVNGVPVGTVTGQDGPFTASVTPPATGSYQFEAIATDTLGRTSTSLINVTVVEADPANPAPTAGLLTPIDGRNLAAGSAVTISATANANSAAGLDHANILVDGVVVATFDALGNLVTSTHEGDAPTRQDASTTPLASLFTAHYQLPVFGKLLSMIVTATDKLGHTSVSGVASFHSRVTTDRAPTVGFANLSGFVKLLVGSINNTQIVGSDPDASATGSLAARTLAVRGPVTRDAASDALLASLEYWINGLNITKVSASPLPVSFSPPTAGKYILHAVATDGSGLATISEPVEVEADPLPDVVSVVISGDGLAVEGGENGKVAVRRTGDSANLANALSVRYKVAGSAKAGLDYKTGPITGIAIIPAGATQVKIKIKPVDNSSVDGTRVAKVKLLPSLDASYSLGTSATVAKIKIIDND